MEGCVNVEGRVIFRDDTLLLSLLRFREKPPQIADNSVLLLRLEGEIPEKTPVELPEFLGGGKGGATVPGIWRNLEKAAADPHIRGIVIEPEHLSTGWAKLEDGQYINPADGGCAGNEQNIERWKDWLAKGYTSKADAEKAK